MSSITVQDAADLMAMVQQLLHKADTGQDATEEQVALRMLGSVFETPENPISNISTLSSDGGDSATAVSEFVSFGRSDNDRLRDELRNLTKSPQQQMNEGNIPLPIPVTVLPNYDSASLRDAYGSLVDATTVCSLYVKRLQLKKRPQGFDITTEASEAFAFMAKSTFDVMMGPLASFYNFTHGSRQTFNNTVEMDKVHENLISKVFAPFQFDANTKKLLDGQLTTFIKAIKSTSVRNTSTESMDFCIRMNLCPKISVSGNQGDKSSVIYQPCTYLIYMRVKARSFAESVEKNSTVQKVNFAFNLNVTKCDLNVGHFEANRPKFDKVFQQLVGMKLETFSRQVAISGTIKTNETNPGAGVKI